MKTNEMSQNVSGNSKLHFESLEEELAFLKEDRANPLQTCLKKKKQKEDILLLRELVTLVALGVLVAFLIFILNH